MAAAAMARCLLAVSLRGSELRTIRRIVGWKASELAEHMDVQASPQTVSRWENDKQKMGGYAQKLFRLNVCEALKDRAPGIAYSAGDVARLRVRDPWRNNQSYQVPPVVLEWMKVQAQDRKLIKAYVDDRPELPKAA
jgi:transcriptional regulator with XRE-family HTH domain